jgi:hypothetical protein
MSDFYFHGDVVLKQIEEIPHNAIIKKGGVIAEGELTGHAHTIDIDLIKSEKVFLLTDEKGVLYLKNEVPIEIGHQQHKGTFTNLSTEVEEKLPVGNWIVDFPIEYDHFEEESKRVSD